MDDSVSESKMGPLEAFSNYMREYVDEFNGLEIADIDTMFEFNVKLEGVLLEAELLGLPLNTALIAPLVGLKLPRLDLTIVGGNIIPIPLAFLVGDICRNDVPMNVVGVQSRNKDECIEVYLPIGSTIYNVNYCDVQNNHQRLMRRFGNLRDVLVPIEYERSESGEILESSLKVGVGYDYYPTLKGDTKLDLATYLPLYMNHYHVTEMCFGDRTMIEVRDRFVSGVVAEYFREIHIPTQMVLDTVETLKLTGDDVRYSRNYRTAKFVENLIACVGKTKNTTVVLN